MLVGKTIKGRALLWRDMEPGSVWGASAKSARQRAVPTWSRMVEGLMDLPPALGIDVGGTNIRAGIVTFSGDFHSVGSVHACETPRPSTPDGLSNALANVRNALGWDGPEAIGFPGRLRAGTVDAATHLDHSWVGRDVSKELSPDNRSTTVLNDADAAGLGEAEFGAAAGSDGLALILTVGTGIGSALVYRGMLLEGTELGLLPCESTTAQGYAAMSVIDQDGLSLEEWAARLGTVLHLYEELLAPDVIVIGGAAARRVEQFRPALEVGCPVLPAHLGTTAGVVGAAFAAAKMHV